MKKKITISLAITVALLAMTVTFSITMIVAMRMFDNQVRSVQQKENMYGKLSEIDEFVRANYYGNINDENLNNTIASGYILGIGDKFATYYTPAAYKEMQDVQSGKIVGIGVEIVKDASGSALITRVYEDSPAEEMDLEVGGYITTVDGVDVKGYARENVSRALRGETGTTVNIGYISPTAEESTIEVTRSSYKVPSVSSEILSGNIGYIRLYSFGTKTARDFSRAIGSMTNAGVKGIIFDVRDNTGRDLEAAAKSLDVICGRGVLAQAEYSDGSIFPLYESERNSVRLPFVCLVNANTAYGAELFAADLQQLAGASLIGVKTAGQGMIVSAPEQLSDGSAVAITVGRLLCPDGTVVDGNGITPNIEAPLTAEEEQIAYSFTIETDPQLRRGIEMMNSLTGANQAQNAEPEQEQEEDEDQEESEEENKESN